MYKIYLIPKNGIGRVCGKIYVFCTDIFEVTHQNKIIQCPQC